MVGIFDVYLNGYYLLCRFYVFCNDSIRFFFIKIKEIYKRKFKTIDFFFVNKFVVLQNIWLSEWILQIQILLQCNGNFNFLRELTFSNLYDKLWIYFQKFYILNDDVDYRIFLNISSVMTASKNLITSLQMTLKRSQWILSDFFFNYVLKGSSYSNPSKMPHPVQTILF